jgi:hypothetical protein
MRTASEFETRYPDVVAWIRSHVHYNPFAKSLARALERYRYLTDRQREAVENAISREAGNRATQDAAATSTYNLTRIKDAMDAALDRARADGAQGIKYLRLTFGGLVFSPASFRSRNPGALYVKREKSPGNGIPSKQYLGKFHNGKFYPSQDCMREDLDLIQAASAVEDLAEAARLHGLKTGVCSCCGRELTHPESIARGIGPICAGRFGW